MPEKKETKATKGRDQITSPASPGGTHAFFHEYELFMVGRSNTILGKSQGDHATALAMVIRGITRIYRTFSNGPPVSGASRERPIYDEENVAKREADFFHLDKSCSGEQK